MYYRKIWALLALILAGFSVQVSASASSHQRKAFKAVAQAIAVGDLDKASSQMPVLKSYILYPYLRYDYLKARLRAGDAEGKAVQAFLKKHSDLPIAPRLRHAWMQHLARQKNWKTFLEHYERKKDGSLRCYAARARLHLARSHDGKPNRDKALVAEALDLWTTGWRRPRACKPVFDWLDSNDRLTPSRYRERVDLALEHGHTGLAKSLADNQKGKDQKTTLARIAARTHPLQWLKKARKQKENGASDKKKKDVIANADMVTEALQRLARAQPSEAAKLYRPLAKAYGLSAHQRGVVQRMIALGYAWDRQPEALDRLAVLKPKMVDATVRSWRIRSALYQQDWDAATAWLRQLPPKEASSIRWQYWKARVLAARGNKKKAKSIYTRVADHNGYYGWMAAGRLGQDYKPHNHSVKAHKAALQKLRAKPGIRRARELYRVGWLHDARAEWQHALSGQSHAVWQQAGLLAQQWGWHSEAIASLAQAGVYDDLALSFPESYHKHVKAMAKKRGIDSAWIYSIMRAESLFMPDARSGAGARGLMQLMPATAREIARREGASFAAASALYEPALNIRLGSHYLQRLASHFGGNLALATAAYNAGPSQVEYWLPDRVLPLDIWVANIPYNQTRHYVQRVLGYMALFEWRLRHRVTAASKRMQPVSATISLADLDP